MEYNKPLCGISDCKSNGGTQNCIGKGCKWISPYWTGDDLAYLETVKMDLVKKQRYYEAGQVRELIKEIQGTKDNKQSYP